VIRLYRARRQRDGRTRPRLAAWIERMNALPRA
jgi:hypothetical protein